MPPALPAFGYIKKPNHLRAEDGWDDSRNFYASLGGEVYRNGSVKVQLLTTPNALTCAVTIPVG